jgi:hypothetical protein
MASLHDLYEPNTKQYRKTAERIDDPVHRLILLQMVRAWLGTAAVTAPTPPSCGHALLSVTRSETCLVQRN